MTPENPSQSSVQSTVIPDPAYAVKTWRYLRLAMIGLVLGLGAAVLFERAKTHHGCFQTSISAYYYTPAHAYFVGALIGIAVCLVCLRGSTGTEDVLLNIAGMFAPIVAFVPTPGPGKCASFLEAAHGLNRNIANNVFALLVVGAVALVVAGILTWRNERTRPALVGYTAALFIWIATALVFALARHFFAGHAHYTAAVLMFGCILIVALNNAFGYKWKGRGESLKNRYMAIAVAMVASAVGVGLAGLLGWRYWTIAIETALITLFAVFWAVQTRELWRPGLRVEGGR